MAKRKRITPFDRDITANRTRLMRAIYRVFNDPDRCRAVLTRLQSPDLGEFDPVTHDKIIDWRGPVVLVLFHEFLHDAYPTWPEAAIEIAETFLGLTLTDRQVRSFVKVIGRAIKNKNGN